MTVDVPWREPDWTTPLDDAAALRAIPETATMTGMFLDAVAKLGRDKGFSPPSARARYTAFQAYPLLERCRIVLEVARAIHPNLPLRQARRRLGLGAPYVLMQSTVGRVVLGSVDGPLATLQAMARSYMLHMRPGSLTVEPHGERAAVVSMREIYNFLDSHNVGVFEGALADARVEGRVRLHSRSATSAELLCEW
ncbi:hypothetical protein BH09MYX1_BH09MYX1_24790 [soil metagenome]